MKSDSIWRHLCGIGELDEDNTDTEKLNYRFNQLDVMDGDSLLVPHFAGYVTAATETAIPATTDTSAWLSDGFTFISGMEIASPMIDDDGVYPDGVGELELNALLYIGLQDPGFSGALLVDPSATVGSAPSPAVATLATFNETLARILKTYYGPVAEALQ